jgi:hypothetical protein
MLPDQAPANRLALEPAPPSRHRRLVRKPWKGLPAQAAEVTEKFSLMSRTGSDHRQVLAGFRSAHNKPSATPRSRTIGSDRRVEGDGIVSRFLRSLTMIDFRALDSGNNFPQNSKKLPEMHCFCFPFAPFLVNNAGPQIASPRGSSSNAQDQDDSRHVVRKAFARSSSCAHTYGPTLC